MVQAISNILTLADFLHLLETKPATEYLNREILQKTIPQGKHSRIQGELITSINLIGKNQKNAYAFPELRCTFGDSSIVPDITILQWERIPCDENGEIANIFASYPDWIIEILSPEQNSTKVVKKILNCLNYGCQLGWLIDPKDKVILVYPQREQPQFLENREDLLPVPNFISELKLTVGEVFDWLIL